MSAATIDSAIGQAYITETRRRLGACHGKIKHCIRQLNEDQIWQRPGESMNSIGILKVGSPLLGHGGVRVRF